MGTSPWGHTVKVLLLTNVSNVEESESVISDKNVEVLIKSNVQLVDILKAVREMLKSD